MSKIDPDSKQRIETVKQLPPGSLVHLIGVCGTGMSAVAVLLKDQGFRVSGSDKAFYPPMGALIKGKVDKVFEGYAAENVASSELGKPDLVVVGNAVSAGHPEVEAVNKLQIPFASMPEVFAARLIGDRDYCPKSVVIAGTHGKTTTSAATASMFEHVGRSPGFFIGGIPEDLPSHIRSVEQQADLAKRVVVLEGDEYDSAFFAKYSKFLSYRPDVAVVTSLEFDHADIYFSIDDIVDTFEHLLTLVPKEGLILLCDQSEKLRDLADTWKKSEAIVAPIEFYGREPSSRYRISSREIEARGQRLLFEFDGKKVEVQTPLSGEYNAQNLLSAAAVGAFCDLEASSIGPALSKFNGVARRQRLIDEIAGVLIMEDFAHHPTAVEQTLRGVREVYPERRLVAVFEPRSNTSRRHFFQDAYAKAFVDCDVAVIKEVLDSGGYSGTGETKGLDVKQLTADILAAGTKAKSFKEVSEICQWLADDLGTGDLVVIMSNGDFGGLLGQLLERLRDRNSA